MNDKKFLISSVSGNTDDHPIVKQSEEEIIREVANEEGLTFEEVKAVWDVFKTEAESFKQNKKENAFIKDKKKSKRKAVKQSRKRNR